MFRAVLTRALYPFLIVASLTFTLVGIRAGYHITLVGMTAVVLTSLPLLIAQRVWPAETSWKAKPERYGIDLLHMMSTGFFTEIVRALSLGAVLQLAVMAHSAMGHSLWPTSVPILFQFALGLLVGDFFAYWVHRGCHWSPFLWRIHAMHHSSDAMYVFAAARNHPFNAMLMHASHLLPLTLLGAPLEVIVLTSTFTGVHGMLQHCNVELRHGLFNHVFATAEMHRWHHSSKMEESNQNFGNNLSIWDTLFGTRHAPHGRPASVGLGEDGMREHFLAHLASPFLLYRAQKR